MAPDVFQEVSSQNWFSRIGSSIVGSIFGIILFIVAIPLLFWNEGRAVTTYRSLKEGAAAVVTVQADAVNAANEGRLVHLTGPATTSAKVQDNAFGLSEDAIKLDRTVEMYQWRENKESKTQKKLGGGEETITTYTYEKKWSGDRINSGEFKHPEDHGNPSQWTWASAEFVASKVAVGPFELSEQLVGQIDNYEKLQVSAETLPAEMKGKIKAAQDGYYAGADPSAPQVGDLRIGFRVVRPGPVSIVARQADSTLTAYQTKAGDAIALLATGAHGSAEMFKAAQDRNTMMTWIIRIAGFLLMFIGLTLVMRPLSVLADVIPFIGSLVEFGTGLLSFLVALVSAAVVVAVAWIVVRPVVGISLLVAVVAIVVLAVKTKKQKAA